MHMMRKKTVDSFPSVTALCLFVFAGLMHTVNTSIPLIDSLAFVTTTFIYMGLILSWAVFIKRRFISDRICKMLLSMAAFFLLYILTRTVKYRFISVNQQTLARFLWYSYYLPQIFAPLISFMTACTVGLPEDRRLSKKWIIAFAAGAVLGVGILTNDYHQLAFRFREGMVDWGSDYSYGFLFYAVTAWIYFFILASIIMLWYKCRVASIKRRVWLPFIWLPIGTLLVLFLAYEPIAGIYSVFKLPEIHCFILIAIWESCIVIGLIPCNTGYSEYFSESGLPAQIADNKNKVVYRSKIALNITEKQMEQAKKGSVLISKNTVLHSNSVSGGNIFWTEDLTAVNEMNRELREIGERLCEESDLLRAENEIKEQKSRLEEQNRLYDNIAVLLKPQLDEIARLLENDDDFEKRIRLVCVLNCYVKRRANLALLADSCKYIDARELYLSVRESVEYVKLCAVSGFVNFSGDCAALSEHILLAFDIWQLWIEAGLGSLTAVMADIFAEEGSLFVKLNLDGGVPITLSEKCRRSLNACGGKMNIAQEDGTLFVRLFLPRGGESG